MSYATLTIRFAAGLFISTATMLVASTSVAQSIIGYGSTTAGPMYHAANPYPVALGFGHYHASTAAEGFLRGRAAVIDALGNFAVNESQAEILREQARSLDRENDLKQTEALQTQLKLWSDARVQSRKARELGAAEGRQLLAERRATYYRQAYQLSASELNLKTGEIFWPTALQCERFQEIRTRVEELFRRHAGYGEGRDATANQIARTIDTWSRTLRSDVGSMPRDEYVAAQKFLLGLKYGAASLVEST